MEEKVFINGRPAEIERKWLIKIPDIKILEKQDMYNVSSIEQIYISDDRSAGGSRIRKRDFGADIKYYKTHKEDINGISRFEEEREISKEEYEVLSQKIRHGTSPIKKKRHSFNYCGFVVEIDIYEFWDDKASMEIELTSEDQQVYVPDFIEIIKEVTGDKSYNNYALACKY